MRPSTSEPDMPGEAEDLSSKIVERCLADSMLRFGELPAEERAYRVIMSYIHLEEPGEEVYCKFVGWFLDVRNAAAKEIALSRIFNEILASREM